MPIKNKMNSPQTPEKNQTRDNFSTPNYATDLIIPYIPKFVKAIWEPAAGNGKIVQRLEAADYPVWATDIRHSTNEFNIDYVDEIFNFLTEEYLGLPQEYKDQMAIITNPPFSLKKEFYNKCVEYGIPFALLIPADYSGWIIKSIQDGAEKIIPTRRVDYITPTGLSGASGHTSNFHSMWLTKGFTLGKSETFVELSLKDKENI
jgi:hypothetical protein